MGEPNRINLARDELNRRWRGVGDADRPPYWLLPDLLALVEQCHDQPAYALRPQVRQIILQQLFIDESGDSVVAADHCEHYIERVVDLMLEVLERVRLTALQRGDWSNLPVTPLMCG